MIDSLSIKYSNGKRYSKVLTLRYLFAFCIGRNIFIFLHSLKKFVVRAFAVFGFVKNALNPLLNTSTYGFIVWFVLELRWISLPILGYWVLQWVFTVSDSMSLVQNLKSICFTNCTLPFQLTPIYHTSLFWNYKIIKVSNFLFFFIKCLNSSPTSCICSLE